MSVSAYLLVKAELEVDRLYLPSRLSQIEGVVTAALVTGPYDVVVEALVDVAFPNELLRRIAEERGVIRVATLVNRPKHG